MLAERGEDTVSPLLFTTPLLFNSTNRGITMTALGANETAEEASTVASVPLRICCYGSSSSRTPAKYTDQAYNLGKILAIRGHTCVNGAGSAGCMAAMNNGAHDNNGHIVGVIHEKFVVDGSDWYEGAHSVFAQEKNEILIAKGNDLQERKKLLVKDADALIVLPGGPGTWDELWEMACARHIGFHSMPIVCVNVEGYYDTFKAILKRAHEDELLYKDPREIVHFEEIPEAAINWVEKYCADPKNQHDKQQKVIKRRSSMLKRLQSNVGRMQSFFGDDLMDDNDTETESQLDESGGIRSSWYYHLLIFSAGLSLGLLIASKRK